MYKVLLYALLINLFINGISNATSYSSDSIIVGKCNLNVYVAETPEEKRKGMLGFTKNTFNKDGMIFLGSIHQKQYYHTIGMEMDIYIIGVNTVGYKRYKVNDKAIFAPSGKKVITVYGDSVLEIPKKLYREKFKNCLYE